MNYRLYKYKYSKHNITAQPLIKQRILLPEILLHTQLYLEGKAQRLTKHQLYQVLAKTSYKWR